MSRPLITSLPAAAALWTVLLSLAVVPAHADVQPVSLDFESTWADLPPNTFVRIDTLSPAPGGLHWGDGWYGQTTSPLQGSNNELRLGGGSFTVDNRDQPFFLDAVDFRSMTNGGSIRFDFIVHPYDPAAVHGMGAAVVYSMKIDGAPDVVLPPLLFTTFAGTAGLGPLHSFGFGNFKTGGETSDRNLFVMDNLQLRLQTPAVPEPGTAALMGVGLMAWLGLRRRARG
jgi:hypothetical protein